MNDDHLKLLTKYLMTSKEDKERNCEQTFAIVHKIVDLFNREGLAFGKGITALLVMLASSAVQGDIPKQVVLHTFSILYDSLKEEEEMENKQ